MAETQELKRAATRFYDRLNDALRMGRLDLLDDVLAPEAIDHNPAGIPMTPPSLASRTEVDKVMQQAEGAGARVIDPPRARFWGGYSGYFQDPVR
jgi:uncharacterized protein